MLWNKFKMFILNDVRYRERNTGWKFGVWQRCIFQISTQENICPLISRQGNRVWLHASLRWNDLEHFGNILDGLFLGAARPVRLLSCLHSVTKKRCRRQTSTHLNYFRPLTNISWQFNFPLWQKVEAQRFQVGSWSLTALLSFHL